MLAKELNDKQPSDNENFTQKVDEDIKYSYSEYKNIASQHSPKDFSGKTPAGTGWCCKTSPIATSNFEEDATKDNTNSKTFYGPKSSTVKITVRTNDQYVFADYNYEIRGKIPNELCLKILTTHYDNAYLFTIEKNKKVYKYGPIGHSYDGAFYLTKKDIPNACSGNIESVEATLD